MVKKIPQSLKNWFLIHFIIDYVFAIPLFIAPNWFLSLFGVETIDLLASRIVAAALFAIGGASLLVRNKSWESYDTLLTVKIIWSSFAIIGALITLFQGGPQISWLVLWIFLIFWLLWTYYKIKLKQG